MDETLFKRMAGATFGAWLLALGAGASHLAVETLFPVHDPVPVDASPSDFPDALSIRHAPSPVAARRGAGPTRPRSLPTTGARAEIGLSGQV